MIANLQKRTRRDGIIECELENWQKTVRLSLIPHTKLN